MKKINETVVYESIPNIKDGKAKLSYVVNRLGGNKFGMIGYETGSEMYSYDEANMDSGRHKYFISEKDFDIFDLSEEITTYMRNEKIENIIMKYKKFFEDYAHGIFISEDNKVCIYLPKDPDNQDPVEEDIKFIKDSLGL